ncbi:GIY-YIG nuclease family protein [Haloflavibacter putidus]|uniref:GIY-YIG nuclease family protein n=1 Tax=Haloflavibacter putidus TaxID=2576776 RepID=A0A507ZVL9_9FLAO|nr:GIY-YIG nuclease family protein [Haloflavibacter putidus]TQD38825.1 GIY-YIG nuclease family protein [Haloflavibacter putidus]
MEEWTVYLLKCENKTIYVGCTSNLERRLKEHNSSKVKSTRYRLPVFCITKIIFRDKYKAFAFEKYLKSGSGRAFLNKRLI